MLRASGCLGLWVMVGLNLRASQTRGPMGNPGIYRDYRGSYEGFYRRNSTYSGANRIMDGRL